MRILITGAGGYVGSLLTTRLLADVAIEKVVATDLDLSQQGVSWPAGDKLVLEQGQLHDLAFVDRLKRHLPIDAVIHAAFQMRAGYGRNAAIVAANNIASCRNVFEFCFANGVRRLFHFSSAAAYGARQGNVAKVFFGEDAPLREERYPYGVQKRVVEELLESRYRELKPDTTVVVLRPCSVTGPLGQRSPNKAISLISFLKRLLPVIPEISPEWARQFLHEEDLVRVVQALLSAPLQGYEIFNLAPHDYLTAADMAAALNKRTIRVPAWMVQVVFSLLWHVTRGRVPTAPGSINSFRYPINMDGRRIQRIGFEYRYQSKAALLADSEA